MDFEPVWEQVWEHAEKSERTPEVMPKGVLDY